MRIYLIRHGQTEWNLQGRIQGREDIPLSKDGVLQARKAGKAISELELETVFSSPLSRASDTATIIAEYVNTPIMTDERLIERDFGAVSGMELDIFNPGEDVEGMEPLDSVSERMLEAITEYAVKAKGDFAVISHGGAINAVLRKLSGGQVGSGKTRLKNTSICVMEWDGRRIKLLDHNMTPEKVKDKYLNKEYH